MKKVNNLLKGVAVTGSAITGASILTDANLAYAAELGEEEVQQMMSEELTIEVHEEAAKEDVCTEIDTLAEDEITADLTVNTTNVVSEDDTSVLSEDVNELESTSTFMPESLSDTEMGTETPVSSNTTSESSTDSVSESAIESESQIDYFTQNQGLAPSNIAVSESLSTTAPSATTSAESEFLSESTATSESLEAEDEYFNSLNEADKERIAAEDRSIAEAIDEAQRVYHYYSEIFSEAGYEDTTLENLIRDIEKAQVYLEERRQFAEDNNQ